MSLEWNKSPLLSFPVAFTVFLGLVVLLVDPFAYHSFTALKNLVFTVGILAFLLWIVIALKKIELGWMTILFAIRIVWLALTNSDWLLHPSNDGFYLSVSLLGLLIICKNLDQKKFFPFFLWVLLVSGIIQTCVGVYQLATYVPNPSIPIKTPFIGTFGTSNGLGIFMVLSIISGLTLCYKHRNPFLYVLTFTTLLGLLFTESRGSLLALFVACSAVLGILFYQKTQRVFLKKALIGVVALTTMVAGLFLYWVDMGSSSGRWMIWEITTLMIEDNPVLGVGHGNYSKEYLNYQAVYFGDESHIENEIKAANIKQAHNEFLQSFAEGGIVSGVLLLIIWILPFFLMFRNSRGDFSGIELAKLGMISAIVFHSLLDSPLHVLPVAIVGYAVVGSVDKNFIALSGKYKHGLTFFVSAYLILVSITKIKAYSGHHFWKEGVEHVRKQQWKLAINDFENALERLPEKGELLYQMGSAHVFDEQYTRGIYFINKSKEHFNDRNIYLSESYALLKLKKYEQAKQSAFTALSMFPTHLAPHLLLGEIYYYLGDTDQSKTYLLKCINEEIEIKSIETKQISEDAKLLWQDLYGTD
ncbi:MAG: O-antigen ligase family protein [Balneolaceae bacterium]